VARFAHIIPALQDIFYFTVRESFPWRVFEGLAGPANFSNLNSQARLAALNDSLRETWHSCGQKGWQIAVLFGRQDPLLADFKDVLEETIDKSALIKMDNDGWIEGAGHYPTEERPESVGDMIDRFADKTIVRQ